MSSFIIALLMSHLAERYQCADDCWDTLRLDSVQFEESTRFELNWCIDKFHRHYDRRPGDHYSSYYKCWEAGSVLRSVSTAKLRAEETGLKVSEIREGAKYILESSACKETREQTLRKAFEKEHAQQVATYECLNAENDINYGPLGMGPYREKDVDLQCWDGGWKPFYVEPDGTTE